jgi:hypothetical protein
MSRRPPPLPDDLAALAAQRIREALEDREANRAAREAQKEMQRRRAQEESRRTLVAVGVGLLVGGLMARVVGSPAAVGLGLLAGGLTIYFFGWFEARPAGAARPEKRAPIDPPAVASADLPTSRKTLIQNVLSEATANLRRLDEAAAALTDAEASGVCARLVSLGQKLTRAVADAPIKLSIAQRTLTYHLPRAVFLAENLVDMQSASDPKRAGAAQHVLGRMEMLFERTLLDMAAPDLAEMDLEMRLINQALDEDLDQGNSKGRPA